MTPYGDIWVCIISVEEAIEGARKLIYKKRQVVAGYALLTRVFIHYSRFQILPFDEAALKAFEAFPKEAKLVSKADRQIAATAVARNYTVVTRNLRDFSRIPGVRCEDWA